MRPAVPCRPLSLPVARRGPDSRAARAGIPLPIVRARDSSTSRCGRGSPACSPVAPNIRRGPINNWTDAASHGAVVALDPHTGERTWTFPMYDLTDAGILTTASDLLFTGGREGYFQALDARTGELLWKVSLGSAQIMMGPITYEVEGKQ